MGQYFKAYVENSASKSLGKMIEFGYMHQSYVATICTMIYQNPQIYHLLLKILVFQDT